MDKFSHNLIIVFIYLLFAHFGLSAQDKSVYGNVIDSLTNKGVASINLINTRSKEVVGTNEKGDYYIRAIKGDSIVISTFGYNRAGIKWDGKDRSPVIRVVQQAIMLQELLVLDKKYDQLKIDIKNFLDNPTDGNALRNEALKRMLNTNTSSPGIGISIDALWDAFSRDGKSKQKLADLGYNDVKQYYAELVYNKQVVTQITKLQDEDLDDFMKFCRPTQSFILSASDYELTFKVLKCLKEYRENKIFRKVR